MGVSPNNVKNYLRRGRLFFSAGPLYFANFRDSSFLVELDLARSAKRVRSEAFLKEIAIDGLGRRGPLASRNNHLTIGRRDATSRIQAGHRRPHALIDLD